MLRIAENDTRSPVESNIYLGIHNRNNKCLNTHMTTNDDLYERRRQRMLEVVKGPGYLGNQASFARACGKSPGQVNDMLAGRRVIGERAARSMADALGYDPDFFDRPADGAPREPAAHEPRVQHASPEHSGPPIPGLPADATAAKEFLWTLIMGMTQADQKFLLDEIYIRAGEAAKAKRGNGEPTAPNPTTTNKFKKRASI